MEGATSYRRQQITAAAAAGVGDPWAEPAPTPAQLKSLVAKNKDTGRGGGGCCGCGKATLLSQWKYLEGKELQGELEGEFATRDALKEQQPSLEAYLGVKPEDPKQACVARLPQRQPRRRLV